ncbi:MAG TPA: hypothetical protein PLA16_04925 [Chitinophagales bacterium]|jgi:LEA14-like dessication related protein|nr:hypothetical protein [Chitinophagales bacterium]HQO31105.1 hypothetical protein [Chitinophagales bacterium]HQO89343.1 hypothetical protein [Chitinophagales bacterium]
MKNTLLLIIFSFTVLLNFAEEPKEPYLVKTKDFHVADFSLKKIDLGITAVIYNPYKAKVKIEEIMIDVFIGDKKLGTILEAAEDVKINKESAFDLPLRISVNTGPTISKFFTEGTRMVILGQKIRVDYRGYVKVRALGFIPVKVKINQTEYFTLKDIMPSGKPDTTKVVKPKKDSTLPKPVKQ